MPQAGTFTALQKLKPITVDWGKVAKTGTDREDVLDARKKAEEKARKDERDKIGYDNLDPVITGIDSLDKGLTLGIQEASTMQYEDYKKALSDPTYADSPEYKIRKKNLNDYSKNVKAFTDGYSTLAQSVIGKSQDGSLSSWDDQLLSELNGGFVSEKVKFGVGASGEVEAYIASTDQSLVTEENPDGYVLDADGKKRISKVTPREIFNGLGRYSVTPDVDIQKTATDLGTKLGEDVKSSINGYEITSEQSWSDKEPETRKLVRGLLGSPNAPTPLAKRLWADVMDNDSRKLSESDMTEIENTMLDNIKPFYDEVVNKSKDFGAQESARGRAEKRNKDNITPAIVPDSDTGKPKVVTVPGTNIKGYAISFGDDTTLQVEDTETSSTFIRNIYYTDKGVFADKIEGEKYKGDPILDGSGNIDWTATIAKEKAKGWEETTNEGGRLTDIELTNLAKNKIVKKKDGSPFKNGEDLVKFLKNQFNEMGGEVKNLNNPSDSVKTQSGNTYN